MRILLAIFLSLVLSFNAAYAAVTDICDLHEQHSELSDASGSAEHAQHFGHHSHHDDHSTAIDVNDPGDTSSETPHTDHSHPHQCFTSVLPAEVALPHLAGNNSHSAKSHEQIVSWLPSLFERPPRAAVA